MTQPVVTHIGRYRVLSMLGKGAMGVVYRAIDPMIDREVAIKTIRLSLPEEELAFYEARFAQEVKTVGKLNHPHIITIYDVGRTEEFAYMAMEFIDGCELKGLMAPGAPMQAATAVEIVAQVADGLAFAHSRDIVHRDVKPANIMVALDDEIVAKIMDFGIARVPTSAVKTMTGTILGSPRYMAPEQVIGKGVGPRSDIFSLGVVLYEMLAGAPPFDAESVSSIMYQTVHEKEEPLRVLNAAVPPQVEAIVTKALAKSPDERYASMKEFYRALRDVAPTLPAPGRLTPAPEVVTPTMAPDTPMPAPIPKLVVEEEAEKPVPLSSEFDSLAAAMRLATLTDQASDLTIFAQTLRMERPKFAEPEPAAPAPKPVEPAKPAAPPPPPAPFPTGAAALLGTLAFVAIALGIAIAL